jgi:hypothetical protein
MLLSQIKVHWPTAKQNCIQMGMTFARFDSQDELEWILSVVPEDNQSGTKSIVKQIYSWII